MILEIEIKNWDKYNARSDVKSCTWFRMSNDFFVDPDFYGASPTTRMVWIYVLCAASKKNNSIVRINSQMLYDVVRTSVSELEIAFLELSNIGCLKILSDSIKSTRSNPIVIKMFPSATDRQTDVQTDPVSDIADDAKQEDFNATPWLLPVQAPKKNLPKTKTQDSLKTGEVINLFNSITGRNFKNVEGNSKHVTARIKDGYTMDDFESVCKFLNGKWSNDPKMCAYLRPETVFGNKFDGYLQESKNAFKPKLDPLDILAEKFNLPGTPLNERLA